MPSPFAITTASNTVLLNDKRQGQALFTVSNTRGRPLRGRARLAPQNPATADWLKIVGEAERELAIAGTQQYPVQVTVPPKAAAGNYTFRLDVVAVDNPDEDFTQGPTVAFQVPPPVRPFPWWILLVVVGVMVVGCLIAAYILWPRSVSVQVPDVVGLQVSVARATVTAAGLKVGDETAQPSDRPKDQVIASVPRPGLQVDRGTALTLVVSSGPALVAVPPVVNETEDAARQKLADACQPSPCLKASVTQAYHNTIKQGVVISSEPSAGTQVAQGTEVKLVVSSGHASVPVPKVVNETEDAARQKLANACQPSPCLKASVTQAYHNTIGEGVVISSEPSAGTQVAQGTEVKLVVSNGPAPVVVPPVANETEDAAKQKLADACQPSPCLKANVKTEANQQIAKGMVIRSVPAPGARVSRGTEVTLVVSSGPRQARVVVTFESIYVKDDADPWPKGDGEIWLDLYVNNARLRWPQKGEASIGSGETKAINQSITALLTENQPLTVYVNGTEYDDDSADDAMGEVKRVLNGAGAWGSGGKYSDASNCPDGCYTIFYRIEVTWL